MEMAGSYLNFYRDCGDIPGDCPATGFHTPGYINLIFYLQWKSPCSSFKRIITGFWIRQAGNICYT
jgi:hypothetical protein